MPPWVLGIDAGNTKTLALLCDPYGQVMGWGRAGQSNIYVSKKRALSAIEQAVQAAWRQAGRAPAPLSALTLSSTGADWPEDMDLLSAALTEWRWAKRVQVVNDAVGALRAGSLAGLGVVVVCGTSAGTAARSLNGQLWHSSFWQEHEGAEELGRLALRAVYRAHLGVGKATALSEVLPGLYGCQNAEELLHCQTKRQAGKRRRSGTLARVLLDQAEAGDSVSRELLTRFGAALGDYALAAARQVGLSGQYLLVTSGGVMRHPCALLREALLARVRASHPEVRWQASLHEPVFGAVVLALEAAGQPVSATLWNNLSETGPPAAWFHS